MMVSPRCRASLRLRTIAVTMPMVAFLFAGCGDLPSSTAPPSRSAVSSLEIIDDTNANVHRIRRALVALCLEKPSLALAAEPTATEPAHAVPGTSEVQIDQWLINTDDLTFRLMTSNAEPIWMVSGTLIEHGDIYIADATISELHYE